MAHPDWLACTVKFDNGGKRSDSPIRSRRYTLPRLAVIY